ncbi:MAG: rod shape-determining protein RodA [Bacteroidota bacterium]
MFQTPNQEDHIRLRKQPVEYFDWSTFLITILIIVFGLISIYSATYDSGMSGYFFRQLIYSGVGIAVLFTFMFLPERWLVNFSYIVYIITLVMLIGVLFFGYEVYGTKGWFQIAGFSIQPAEFAKLSTLMVIAQHLSRKGTNIKTIRDFGIVFGLILVPVILIFIQPDLGSSTVLLALFLGILYWTGYDILIVFFVTSVPVVFVSSLMNTAYLIASVSVYAIIAALLRRRIILTFLSILLIFGIGYISPILVNNLKPHQKNRIETFLYPDKDPLGKGYNVIQSKLAVGSGGLAGKGFLQGTQTQLRYIPKQWTDFIFCVPAEEFGFIGGAFVILLLILLVLKGVKIAYEVDSMYFSIVCFGSSIIFFYHTVVNVGMVLGLVPVMGIPLPFMSYGGSSLLVNCAMVGFILNAYRTKKLIKKPKDMINY